MSEYIAKFLKSFHKAMSNKLGVAKELVSSIYSYKQKQKFQKSDKSFHFRLNLIN